MTNLGNYSRPDLFPSSFMSYIYNTDGDDNPTEAVLYILVNDKIAVDVADHCGAGDPCVLRGPGGLDASSQLCW